MRTKAQVLQAKLAYLAEQTERLRREIDGLQRTHYHGRPCEGCGAVFATEWDFARHFEIPDERYLNLGNCPIRDRGINSARVTVDWQVTTKIV